MPLGKSQLPEADDVAAIHTALDHIQNRIADATEEDPVTNEELIGILSKLNLVLFFTSQAPGLYTAMGAQLNALGVDPNG